ncbi:MAG: hypothetical protein FIA92_15950 [Chloroflexi bacterium]|nr:hypothetical protein [Chloroflexota bacterium]
MIQEFWGKLNPNERMVAWGAIAIIVLSILGGGWLGLIGAAAVLVIYWLQYSPDQNIKWPAPVPLIVLVISAVLAISAVLGVLTVFGFAGMGFGLAYGLGFGLLGGLYVLYMIAAIVGLIAAAAMALGAWREYQKSAPRS